MDKQEYATSPEEVRARFLSCADTAKLVRRALKAAFPATRFSVRSSVYSMGASIYVTWSDGPEMDVVRSVVESYERARFDAMNNLKTRVTHWLMPDGSTVLADDGGTTDSGGVRAPTSKPRPVEDAELVLFGADFIDCVRETADV